MIFFRTSISFVACALNIWSILSSSGVQVKPRRVVVRDMKRIKAKSRCNSHGIFLGDRKCSAKTLSTYNGQDRRLRQSERAKEQPPKDGIPYRKPLRLLSLRIFAGSLLALVRRTTYAFDLRSIETCSYLLATVRNWSNITLCY